MMRTTAKQVSSTHTNQHCRVTSSSGFSLIELMMAIVILGVVMAFAVPSFQSTMANNRLVSCSNKVAAAVQFAKSQAIVLRQQIVVSGLKGAAAEYKVGTDPDGNNIVDAADEMKVFSCDSDDVTVTPTPDVDFISYGTSGFRADGQGQVTFLTCNDKGKGKSLTVSTGGGVSSKDAADGDC